MPMHAQNGFDNQIAPGRRTVGRQTILVTAAAFVLGASPGTTWATEPRRLEEPLRLSGNTYRLQQVNATPAGAVAETPGQQLARVKDTLSPSISDLADAFHVSRQSIYKWLKDEPLAEDNAVKLHDLASAADMIAQAGFAKDRGLLRRRFSDGKTLLQVFAAGGSAREAADKLIVVLQREQAESARLSSRLAGRTSRAPSADFDFPAAG
jgi:hypothetical protein